MKTNCITDEEIPALLFLLDDIRKHQFNNVRTPNSAHLNEVLKWTPEPSPSKKTLSRLFKFLEEDQGSRPTYSTIEAILPFYLEEEGVISFKEFIQDFGEVIEQYPQRLRPDYEILVVNPEGAPLKTEKEVETPSAEKTLTNYYDDLKSQEPLDGFYWLIEQSKADSNEGKPLIGLVKDIDLHDEYWENQAFAIQVLFQRPIQLVREDDRIVLKVSTEGEHYGIYNNGGKKLLRNLFKRSSAKILELNQFNSKLNEFIAKNEAAQDFSITDHPYRWASGGAIPIVKHQDKQWVLLFFRDIAPMGWNVANGASENETERVHLNELIYREFAEEVNIVSGYPTSDSSIVQKQFYKSDMIRGDVFLSRKFYLKQHALRCLQDQLTLRFDRKPEYRTRVQTIPTMFDVSVDNENICGDVIFNINPFEYGIEVLRLIKFNLADDDYILDGEMHESEDFLMRRPCLLLSVDFLKSRFQKDSELGVLLDDTNLQQEIKTLESIPKTAFKMFTADIDLKRKRLTAMENDNELEKTFYSEWLTDFEPLFRKVVNKKDESISDIEGKQNPLTWLCPTTWKSLEMAFNNNLL